MGLELSLRKSPESRKRAGRLLFARIRSARTGPQMRAGSSYYVRPLVLRGMRAGSSCYAECVPTALILRPSYHGRIRGRIPAAHTTGGRFDRQRHIGDAYWRTGGRRWRVKEGDSYRYMIDDTCVHIYIYICICICIIYIYIYIYIYIHTCMHTRCAIYDLVTHNARFPEVGSATSLAGCPPHS